MRKRQTGTCSGAIIRTKDAQIVDSNEILYVTSPLSFFIKKKGRNVSIKILPQQMN